MKSYLLPMPRDGAVTLSDLPARGLDRLRVSCGMSRRGGLNRLESARRRWSEDQEFSNLQRGYRRLSELYAVAFMDKSGV
jgi:hypothetical protein